MCTVLFLANVCSDRFRHEQGPRLFKYLSILSESAVLARFAAIGAVHVSCAKVSSEVANDGIFNGERQLQLGLQRL